MMFLNKVRVTFIVKKQYFYKLKTYNTMLHSLIFMQLIAIIFSLNGSGTFGSSFGQSWLEISYYTADLVIGFTMVWGMIIAIQIKTKKDNVYFHFINNKMTDHFANVLFLFTASVVGGGTAFLSGYLLKVIAYLFPSNVPTLMFDIPSGLEFIIGITVTILFIFLFCMLGYFIGSIVRLHSMFIILLPVLFLGLLFMPSLHNENMFMMEVLEFFFLEKNYFMFVLKVLVASGILYGVAILISKRLEWRQ